MEAANPKPDSLERLIQVVDAPADVPGVNLPPADGGPVWLDAGSWHAFARPRHAVPAGEVVATFRDPDGVELTAVRDAATGTVSTPFDLGEAYANFLSERWREGTAQRRLATSQLDVYYRLKRFIPRDVQLRARQALARWQKAPEFPRWPFEASVFELLRLHVRLLLLRIDRTEQRFRWFWPDGHVAALILTHDVESGEGLRLSVELADLEEAHGLRSSFNIVADWYPIDEGIIRELAGRGFEIGVHGVYHDRSMFSSREMFDAQQPALRAAAERLGAKGFRSPATHRVYDWLRDLPVDYDASIPHSDPYEPQPGGCCSVWPFFNGRVVELPYTVPQDHTTFTVLQRRSTELWSQQVERLVAANGLIQCVTHPDPGYLGDADKRALYDGFLAEVAARAELWKPLPREAAAWWRQRDAGEAGPLPAVDGVASLDADEVFFRVAADVRQSSSSQSGTNVLGGDLPSDLATVAP